MRAVGVRSRKVSPRALGTTQSVCGHPPPPGGGGLPPRHKAPLHREPVTPPRHPSATTAKLPLMVTTLKENLPIPYKTGKGLYWSDTIARPDKQQC